MAFFYTYVLRSKRDGNYYVGSTKDLRKRFMQHNQGTTYSTRWRAPFNLIYYEACLAEADARQREKYLKNTIGRRYLAKRLRNYRSKVTG